MTEVWQDIATGFGLGFTAYAATNLDNMLLICGLLASGARRGSVTVGFIMAGSLVVLFTLSFSVLSCLLPPDMLGYLDLDLIQEVCIGGCRIHLLQDLQQRIGENAPGFAIYKDFLSRFR